jgi:zinc transporter ZupT
MTIYVVGGFVVLAFVLAVLGGATGAWFGTSHKSLCALISLGAGTLLGVTVFAILPEAAAGLNWWELTVALASGYMLFALISKYIYHVCPACAASHFDEATTHRFSEIASAMMIALAIHCVADGMAIAAGRQAQFANAPGGHALNLSLIVAICVHKVPEGLALGALLLGAGVNRMGVVTRVAGVEAATLVGGAAGWFLVPHVNMAWLDGLVAHVGGGFIFLAAHAVLGEILKHHKVLVLSNFSFGFFAIAGLCFWLR